jgi:hypothetical protein
MVAKASSQAAVDGGGEHHPGIAHGQGHLFQLGIDGAGFEKNDAVGGADMLGRHGGQHGDARAAKHDIAVADLPGRGHGHHLSAGIVRFSGHGSFFFPSPFWKGSLQFSIFVSVFGFPRKKSVFRRVRIKAEICESRGMRRIMVRRSDE